ncbi:hypothetical protein VTO42DRAFT_2321 [Malbranchea cinnamomea]
MTSRARRSLRAITIIGSTYCLQSTTARLVSSQIKPRHLGRMMKVEIENFKWRMEKNMKEEIGGKKV